MTRAAAVESIKKIVLSNCAAIVYGIAIFLLHVRCFMAAGAERKVEVVSGFGAALVALGIWLAVRPFFRKGICQAIEEATGKEMPPLLGFFAPPGYHAEREAQRPQVRRDVIGDRIGLVLIFVGTLVNGYSAPIARAAVRLTMDIQKVDWDFWVRVAQIVTTLIAAGVAVYVGRHWLKTLQNKAIDECLAAVYDVVDLIDRCFSIPADQTDNRWRAYDEAWDSWRKASGMWTVVRRYYDRLPPHYVNNLSDILLRVKPLLESKLSNEDTKVVELREAARTFRKNADERLANPRRNWQ